MRCENAQEGAVHRKGKADAGLCRLPQAVCPFCHRTTNIDFAIEMRRSVAEHLKRYQ